MKENCLEELSSKDTISSEDLPKLKDCINYYKEQDVFYVEHAIESIYRYSPNTILFVLNCGILPIKSNPVDADSDNDGVIDKYDENPLDGNISNLTNDGDLGEVFTVLKCYDKSDYIVIKIANTADVYSVPKVNANKIIGTFEIDDQFVVQSLVFTWSEYWLKVWLEKYGVWGYMKYTSTNTKIPLIEDMVVLNNKLKETIDTYYTNQPSKYYLSSSDSCKFYEDTGFTSVDSAEYVFYHGDWSFYQCAAFAAYVYCYVWNEYMPTNNMGNDGNPKISFSTGDEAKAYFKNLIPGTYMRISTSSYYHSIIIAYTSEDTLAIFDANNDGQNGVSYREVSYENFVNSYKSFKDNKLHIYSCYNPYYFL